MKEKTISIIIPAYNAEKKLGECIESIEAQTYRNIEIIIINDGSKDNTKIICSEKADKYNNIIVINQENKGVSLTRNVGIDKATGDYIMFVDSDDFIEKNMLESMLKKNEYDLVISNYKKYYNKNRIINNEAIVNKEYSKSTFLKEFWTLYNANLINSPCFRLYKNDIIKNENIRFNSNYELGEDLIFNLEYIDKCERISVINEYLYNYRYSEQSLTTKYRENYLEIQYELIEYIRNFLVKNNALNENHKKNLEKLTCDVIISAIQNLFLKSSKLTNKEKKLKLNEYLKLKEIEYFNNVCYKEKRLKLMSKLILKKKTNTIIIYSNIKEIIKKILKR